MICFFGVQGVAFRMVSLEVCFGVLKVHGVWVSEAFYIVEVPRV